MANITNKKIIIVAIVVIVIAFAAFFLFKKKPTAYNTNLLADQDDRVGGAGGNSNAGSTTGGSATPQKRSDAVFPLKKGSRGNEVKNIQRAFNWHNENYLKGKGFPALVEDGILGTKTLMANGKLFIGSPDEITEGRYNWVMGKFLSRKPLFNETATAKKSILPMSLSVLGFFNGFSGGAPIQTDYFPLKLGSIGPRVRELNIAMGLYDRNTQDENALRFDKRTLLQLYAKFKVKEVTAATYGHIMEIASSNQALLAGTANTSSIVNASIL